MPAPLYGYPITCLRRPMEWQDEGNIKPKRNCIKQSPSATPCHIRSNARVHETKKKYFSRPSTRCFHGIFPDCPRSYSLLPCQDYLRVSRHGKKKGFRPVSEAFLPKFHNEEGVPTRIAIRVAKVPSRGETTCISCEQMGRRTTQQFFRKE